MKRKILPFAKKCLVSALLVLVCPTLITPQTGFLSKRPFPQPALNYDESAGEEPQTPTGLSKFALLVGINTYKNAPSPKNLSGAENDVKLMRELLQSKEFGFDAEAGIKELLSLAATKKAILDSIDSHLIANAKRFYEENKLNSIDKGAAIVFHYSGHGSYVKDDEAGEEIDGLDETIVPSDASLRDPDSEIRDDELNDKFQALRKYTSNITFIFDSCHSGTITRAGSSDDPNDAAERRWVKDEIKNVESNARGESNSPNLRDGVFETNEGYVTLSGSLPNELSEEISLPVPGSRYQKQRNGLLTYYFVQILKKNPNASYRDIMNQVKAAVTEQNPAQHPQIEGDIDRVVFTTSGSGSRKNPIKVLKVEKATKKLPDGKTAEMFLIDIDAGKIVGAYPGGQVGIYKPSAVQLSGDTDRITSGEIIKSDEFTATVEATSADTITSDAKIIIATPFFSLEKSPVALDTTAASGSSRSVQSGDAGLKLINQLEKALKTDSYVTPVKQQNPLSPANKDKWKVAVVRAKYSEFLKGNIQPNTRDANTPADTDEVYYLSNRSGTALYNFYVKPTDEKAVERITTALQSAVRIRNLETISNAASDMSKALKIELVRVKEFKNILAGSCDEKIIPVDEKQRAVDRKLTPQIHPGEMFYFEITNNSTVPLYPYLYSLSTDGSVGMLFPISGAAAEPLEPGQTLKYPQAKVCLPYRATPLEKMVGGQKIINPTPYGSETYKLIGSSQPFDGELLTSPSIAGLVTKGERTTRGDSPLGKLFAQATVNKRSSELAPPSFSGWVTISLNVEIIPK